MKRYVLAAVVTVLLLTCVSVSYGIDWKEIKGKHFIFHYYTKEEKEFTKKALKKAEGYYKSIPAKLGVTRYSNFWTWDNRVKFYIYPDRTSFLDATGKPGWVRALADYRKREITSYKGQKEAVFLGSILPHEMAHLILRDFIGLKKDVPLWLDEGVAQVMEVGKVKIADLYTKKLLKTDNFMTVPTLTKLNLRRVRDRDVINAFYMESCSLVNFMIEEYGSEKFTRFCRKLRDDKTLNEALSAVYSASIKDIDKLNAKWLEHLRE